MTEDEITREPDINYHPSVKPGFSGISRGFTKNALGISDTAVPPVCSSSWTVTTASVTRGSKAGRPAAGAQRVVSTSKKLFPETQLEDICDPVGAQRSDKSEQTGIEILNNPGLYPYYGRSNV